MDNGLISLEKLSLGSIGRVKELITEGVARRRMLDLGLIHDTIIKPLMKSPAGDPIAYEIRGAVIALRSEEASKILVEKAQLN
ncbi:MAG TPA: ferrous iron transport protein A [Clostridiales bacterium]|nr:FeoA family protein [Clostridia bacterium]MDD4679723.1 FeoA family protein [Clostridia bacterium]HCS74738.1 ferrous iron transport protein A [Clostridiales bacterium]